MYELDLNGIQFSLSVLHAYTKITNNNLVINSLYHVVSKNNMNKKSNNAKILKQKRCQQFHSLFPNIEIYHSVLSLETFAKLVFEFCIKKSVYKRIDEVIQKHKSKQKEPNSHFIPGHGVKCKVFTCIQ